MYEYKAKVNKVIDGDTIDVTIDLGFSVLIEERVRLYGINCPETRTSDAFEKSKGLKAKEFTINKLPVGKEIVMRSKAFNKEKYGRILAEVIIEDFNLNQELLKEGLAIPFMV